MNGQLGSHTDDDEEKQHEDGEMMVHNNLWKQRRETIQEKMNSEEQIERVPWNNFNNNKILE